jgi:probable F420-dependent oxidoreductase
MKYGIHLFATKDSIQPGEIAREAEARGFVSVLFSEHTHIPVNYLENESGRNLNSYYWQTYDPFMSAVKAASTTTKINVGTGVSLILQHDPITLAKQVATVDHLSEGRFIFGVGAGWNAEEMGNHGVAYSSRFRRIDEVVEAMKVIWQADQPEYQGEFVNFSKIKAEPKPLQSPYPPLISGGGAGPKSLQFAARHCDGWMPILGYPDWPEIKAGIPELHKLTEDAGRDPRKLELSIFAWSLPDEKTLEEMAAAGFQTIVVSLEARGREDALASMDKLAG